MTTQTITADPSLLKEMNRYYHAHKKSSAPPYSHFQAKKEGVTITAYQSGKVVFQGHGAKEEAERWAPSLPSSPSASDPSSALPADFQDWSVLGSDEVGNGSYFGPLTVCAAYAPADQLPLLKELGVKDSKHLTDSTIQDLAWQIKASIPYKLLVVSPAKYNSVQPTMSQNKMKALLHNQALHLVLDQIAPDQPQAILIDQFEEEKYYFAHIKQAQRQVKDRVYFQKRAESCHLSVAAASIIARDQFLKDMAALSELAGMDLLIGASQAVDRQAAQIINRPDLDLKDFAKLHFANTKKASELAKL